MARPRTITNEQILNKARELFLQRGPGVPTAAIARAVGISEGSIFKRFPTKQKLFLAAMGVDELSGWTESLPQMVGQGQLRENLIQIAVRMTEFFRQLLPRLMLLWSCRAEHAKHLKAMRAEDAPPRRGLRALARYLDAEMQLGRMRQGDAEVVARIFLGSIWNLVFMETVGQADAPISSQSYATRLVDALWNGLNPGAARDDR